MGKTVWALQCHDDIHNSDTQATRCRDAVLLDNNKHIAASDDAVLG